MPPPVIIVTGANGQLGREIRDLEKQYPSFHFVFLTREDLPIHESDRVQQYFDNLRPQYCINCAAYTAVDKSETDRETAMLVNAAAPGVLAAICKKFHTRFIHVSTDYVFDGTASVPYEETVDTKPVNYYGSTKLAGEQQVIQNNDQSIIIRTSWVYSAYGNNFVKTMMRLMKERERVQVVNDQVGSPTYAADLARAMLTIIEKAEKDASAWVAGIYHYSNDGVISWYELAVAIKKLTDSSCTVHPIATAAYPTPAKRPAYSVLNKDKIKSTYQLAIEPWQARLVAAIARMLP